MTCIKIVFLLAAIGVQWMECVPIPSAPKREYNQTIMNRVKEFLQRDKNSSLPYTLKCSIYLPKNNSSIENPQFSVSISNETDTNHQAHSSLSEIKTRKKRYVLNPERRKWSKSHITYTVFSYPNVFDLSKSEVDEAIQLAFEVWAENTPFSFTHVVSGGDISIGFTPKRHFRDEMMQLVQCDVFYDTVLAHASFPNYGSDYIHFNYLQTWNRAMLFKVAVHEIGHTLGLDHFEDSVIMQEGPDDGNTPESSYLKLSWDDVKGLWDLYDWDFIDLIYSYLTKLDFETSSKGLEIN